MRNAQDVQKFLLEAGVPVSGVAIRDSEGDGIYYVFVEVRRDTRGRQEPSNAALDVARATLGDMGATVDFILTDGTMRDAEAGLRATLLHSFGGSVRNSFLSTRTRDGFVWIVPKRALNETELDEISAKARLFLEDVGLTLRQITTTTGENLPSRTRCLAMLKQASPATSPQLAELLREQGFVVPSDDWMTRRLDVLRKSGQVVRMRSGRYAVSLAALRGLGTVKGRASPDITRLLALVNHRG